MWSSACEHGGPEHRTTQSGYSRKAWSRVEQKSKQLEWREMFSLENLMNCFVFQEVYFAVTYVNIPTPSVF